MKKILAATAVAALCLALGMTLGANKREGITLVIESGE